MQLNKLKNTLSKSSSMSDSQVAEHSLQLISDLKQEFYRRKQVNPSYSLRAFAKQAQIPPGRMSEILSGKRELTPRLAQLIAVNIFKSSEDRLSYLSFIKGLPLDFQTKRNIRKLKDSEFSLVADPRHFTLLSLIETKDFKYDLSWMSQRLGIQIFETQSLIENLRQLNIIQIENNSIKLKQVSVNTTNEIPSSALKTSHKVTLEEATEALELPVEIRDISSLTMAINISKLPEAKKLIRQFKQKMSKLLEQDNRTEVYNLNIQLVPATKLNAGTVKSIKRKKGNNL